jgi:hypothetical protein
MKTGPETPGQQSKTQAGNKTRAAVLKATVFLSDLPPGGALWLNNDQPSTIAV